MNIIICEAMPNGELLSGKDEALIADGDASSYTDFRQYCNNRSVSVQA